MPACLGHTSTEAHVNSLSDTHMQSMQEQILRSCATIDRILAETDDPSGTTYMSEALASWSILGS